MRPSRQFATYAAIACCATFLSTSAHSAAAQLPLPPIVVAHRTPPTPQIADEDSRSGPRVGVAALIGGSVTAENIGHPISPITSLFGWQTEHQFSPGPGMPTPITELVGLVGGMEQGVFLPSLSWLIGVRQPNGWEAAVGPTLTGAGLQIAFAAGMTHSFGQLNVPVNLAVAPGRRGASISLTTGFNMKRVH
jgi:hypothetical protein